jgi:hypothetical protein
MDLDGLDDLFVAVDDAEQAGPTNTPAKASSPPPEQAEEITEPMDLDGLDDLFEDADEEQDMEMIEVEDASEGEDDGFVYFLCSRK